MRQRKAPRYKYVTDMYQVAKCYQICMQVQIPSETESVTEKYRKNKKRNLERSSAELKVRIGHPNIESLANNHNAKNAPNM